MAINAKTIVFVATFAAAMFIGVAPTATAHDPDCLTSFHLGHLSHHQWCENHRRDDSFCILSVKFYFFHQRIACE